MKEKQRLHTEEKTHKGVYTRGKSTHGENYTKKGSRCGEGGVYMVECTHERVYMEEYTHEIVYTWRSVHMEECTHKRKIHTKENTCGGE